MEKNIKKTSVTEIIDEYKKIKSGGSSSPVGNKNKTEETSNKNIQQKEVDNDLMLSYETISLPSKGIFYENGLKEVDVEYMTSKDEDLLTTPSLIEKGVVIDRLLKRKIKTPVNIDDLLPGDKSAIILFLRTSSYGPEYTVEVQDPRTGDYFKEKVDLFKLKHKEIKEKPDENNNFTVEIPMRKKLVKFRLLTSGEEDTIRKTAETLQKEFDEEFAEYSTLRLKSSIVSIDGKTDRDYINKFVDTMPALDSLTIKKKINEVSPEFDMNYTFKTKDGYEFKAYLVVGADFFFPNI